MQAARGWHTRTTLDVSVLDAIRGLAALYVVLFHARWLLTWPALSGTDSGLKHGIVAAVSTSLSFGHLPVLVFFLISGFCIHFRQAQKLASARTGSWWHPFDIGSFGWRRIRRLYPPLLAALAITALLDYVGMHLNASYYAGQSQYDSFNVYLSQNGHDWWTLLGSATFQAGLLGFNVFGTDLPLWSLSYEFWFYALYPLVLIAATRFGPRGVLVVSMPVSALALIAVLDDPTWVGAWLPRLLTYWVVWAAGALLAEAYVGRIRLRGLGMLVPWALLVIVADALNFAHPVIAMEEPVRDLIWSAGLVVLLAWALLECPAAVAPRVHRFAASATPLGNISYSLYVVHMPVLFLLSAWWLSAHSALPAGVELATAGVVGALAMAVVCWYLVERHCVSRRTTRPAVIEAADTKRTQQIGGVGLATPGS